jgi:hypothetical protein
MIFTPGSIDRFFQMRSLMVGMSALVRVESDADQGDRLETACIFRK